MDIKTKNYALTDDELVITKQAISDGMSVDSIMKETGASIKIIDTKQDMREMGGRKVACFVYECSVVKLSDEDIKAIKLAEEKIRVEKEEATLKRVEELKKASSVKEFPPPLDVDTSKV